MKRKEAPEIKAETEGDLAKEATSIIKGANLPIKAIVLAEEEPTEGRTALEGAVLIKEGLLLAR